MEVLNCSWAVLGVSVVFQDGSGMVVYGSKWFCNGCGVTQGGSVVVQNGSRVVPVGSAPGMGRFTYCNFYLL